MIVYIDDIYPVTCNYIIIKDLQDKFSYNCVTHTCTFNEDLNPLVKCNSVIKRNLFTYRLYIFTFVINV